MSPTLTSSLRFLSLAAISALLIRAGAAQDLIRTKWYDASPFVCLETQRLPGALGASPDLDPATGRTNTAAPDGSRLFDEAVCQIEMADWVAMLQQATDPAYWEQEGVGIRPEESGLIAVTCEGDMHRKIAAFYRDWLQACLEQVSVEVHLLPRAVLAEGSARLDKEQVDRLLLAAPAHQMLVGSCRIDSEMLLSATEADRYVAACNMEVARDAAMPDPQLGTLLLGNTWRIRMLSASAGRVMLFVWGQHAAPIGTPAERQIPSGNQQDPGGTICLQLPAHELFGIEASAILGDGQGLLCGSDADGGQACLVRLRRPHPVTDLKVGDWMRHSIQYLRASSRPAIATMSADESHPLFPELDQEPLPATIDEGRLVELLTSTICPDQWDGSPFTMNVLAGHLYVRADLEIQQLIRAQLDELSQFVLRQYTIEVRHGTIDQQQLGQIDPDDAQALADRLPLRCLGIARRSAGFSILASRSSAIVANYKAALASEAVVAQPVFGTVLEGAQVACDVFPMSDTQLRLRLKVRLVDLAGPVDSFDLQDERFGTIDLPRQTWNSFEVLPTVTLGEWTLVRLTPVPGGTDHLAVVVRVQKN